jgi:hypothetical protein
MWLIEMCEQPVSLSSRKFSVEQVIEGEVPKGSLILVRWLDASELRMSLGEHESSQGVVCKDWGLFLGVCGRKRRMLLVGKDIVEAHNEWGATRIPVELVEEVQVLMPREEVGAVIHEAQALGRRVSLRRLGGGERTVVGVV